MTATICTVVTRNRLAHARVLASSFLEHEPDGRMVALVVDDVDAEVAGEPFEVVRPADLDLAADEFLRMAAIYSPYELSGALKPWVIDHVLRSGPSEVLYLDSDARVFAPLGDALALARAHQLILTPHFVEPPPRPPVSAEEEGSLLSGIYNSGFLGVAAEAAAFLDWWQARLGRDCVLRPGHGYWTDQRWLNVVPGYFPHRVLRDPGYNVASWNLFTRQVERAGNSYRVNGSPLRVFHFARFEATRPHQASSQSRLRLSRHPVLAEIYRAYARDLIEAGHEEDSQEPYAFGRLSTGLALDGTMRRIYRAALVHAERRGEQKPPNPFDDGPETFLAWLNEDVWDPAGPDTRYLRERRRARDFREEDVAPELRPVRSPHGLDPPRPERLEPGVNLVLRRARSGTLDEVGRRLGRCLTAAGIPFETIWWDEHADRGEPLFEPIHPAEAPYDTNLLCLNPLALGGFAFNVPRAFFADRYSIGLWLDEQTPLPSIDVGLGFLDEVWLASDYAAEGLIARTPKPVRVLPIPIDAPASGVRAADLGLPEGFLFLTVADLGEATARGRFERANPLAAVRAFDRAFAPGEGPALVVRTVDGDEHIDELEQLLLETDREDVVVIDGPLAPEERHALVSACDCYVSLHRAVEFGVVIAEAMGAARPVVATGFSGNRQFMDDENSYLAGHGTAPLGERHNAYWLAPPWSDVSWAEPSIEDAARLLRYVLEKSAEAEACALRGRATISERFSIDAAAEFLRRRLAEVRDLAGGSETSEMEASSATAPEPGAPTALQRSIAHVEGVLLSPRGPSRLGFPGKLARSAVLRAIRPYTVRRHALDVAIVETLAELNHRQAETEARLAEIGEMLRVLVGDRAR